MIYVPFGHPLSPDFEEEPNSGENIEDCCSVDVESVFDYGDEMEME